MKYLKHTIGLSILILSLAITAFAAPQIAVNNNAFDFGYVPQKAKLSHTFWISSTGTDVLNITKVVPGCGCTKAPLASNEIAPGDSTSLEIIFSTKTYNKKVTKRPKIFSDAKSDAELVSFSAYVVTDQREALPLMIVPFAVNQSHFDPKNNSATFKITNQSGKELSISLVDSPENVMRVILPTRIQPNETLEGKILMREGFENAPIEKSITLELDDETKTRFTIPIAHKVKTLSSK